MNPKYFYYSIRTTKNKLNVCKMSREDYTLNEFNNKIDDLNDQCEIEKYIITPEQEEFNSTIQGSKFKYVISEFCAGAWEGIEIIYKWFLLPPIKLVWVILKYFFGIIAKSFSALCSWLKEILIKLFTFLFKIGTIAGRLFLIWKFLIESKL